MNEAAIPAIRAWVPQKSKFKIKPYARIALAGFATGSLIAGSFLLWQSGAKHPSNFVDAVSLTKKSVAPVVCVDKESIRTSEVKLDSIEGTAFFLRADGTFATAGHVVQGLTSPNRSTPCQAAAIYLPMHDWKPRATKFRVGYFPFSASNCTMSEDFDIAICKSVRDIRPVLGREPSAVTLDTELKDDGTQVAFTGFPLSSAVPLTSRGFTSGYSNTRDEKGPRDLIIDKSAWPGASGSPIYLENGTVIGILLVRGINNGSGLTWGRPASFIEKVLAQRDKEDIGGTK
jgi:hypothetical protein